MTQGYIVRVYLAFVLENSEPTAFLYQQTVTATETIYWFRVAKY